MRPGAPADGMHGNGDYGNSGEALLKPAICARVPVVVGDLAVSSPPVEPVRLGQALMRVPSNNLETPRPCAALELIQQPPPSPRRPGQRRPPGITSSPASSSPIGRPPVRPSDRARLSVTSARSAATIRCASSSSGPTSRIRSPHPQVDITVWVLSASRARYADPAIRPTVARHRITPADISQRVSTLELWIISPRSTAVSTLRDLIEP
jgi:hypothetical protein